MKEVEEGYGVMGFVRFLFGYYLVLITKKECKAVLGKHLLFSVSKFKCVRLFSYEEGTSREEKQREEKYLKIF